MSLCDILTKEPICSHIFQYFISSDIYYLSRVCKSLFDSYWSIDTLQKFISRYGIDISYFLPSSVDDLYTFILFLETKMHHNERTNGEYKFIQGDHNYLRKYSTLQSELKNEDENDDDGDHVENLELYARTKVIELSSVEDFDFISDQNLSLDHLVEKSDLLKSLVGVNFGNYNYEFCELTWSPSVNYGNFLSAFPNLFFFYCKNGENSSIFSAMTYPNMVYFGIESAGIPDSMINTLMSSHFPNLFYLELWVGCEMRGCTATPDLFQPLWDCTICPKLRRLDIKNTEEISSFIPFITKSKLIKQLEILDFSLGTLKSSDVLSLIEMINNSNLKKLIVHNCHIPEENLAPLDDVCKSREVILEVSHSGYDDGDGNYIAVSE